jgi:hypothetical protein
MFEKVFAVSKVNREFHGEGEGVKDPNEYNYVLFFIFVKYLKISCTEF